MRVAIDEGTARRLAVTHLQNPNWEPAVVRVEDAGSSWRVFYNSRIYVETRVGRRRKTITVDNSGLPFVTSGGQEARLREASLWFWLDPGRFVDPDGHGRWL